MKKFIYIFFLTLVLVSCGTDGQHFKIDGRLLHLNQGEFYVYSPDGDLGGLDTIKVVGGRFTYEMRCTRPVTLMIVFPNYTEQPVFAEPGKEVKVDGSASNLKEMTVKGTDDNKLMNSFREMIANASPPEVIKHAGNFVEDHPGSAVSTYLVRRYFIQSPAADYAKAQTLLNLILKHQPENGYAKRMLAQIKGLGQLSEGSDMPWFKAIDTDGNSVTSSDLLKAPATVVCAWASWNFQSISIFRQIAEMQTKADGRWNVVGICLDASVDECKRTVRNNNIKCPVICDGKMTENSVYRAFGFAYIPECIIFKNGKVAHRKLSDNELREILKEL